MINKDTAMLIVFEGMSPKQQWILQDAIVIIGRGEDCQIIIEDRQTSRHHARITQSAQGYILEDLDSKNGTYLNGQPLTAAKVLEDGDEIGIAFAAKLSFVDSGATVPLVFEARTEPQIQVDQAAKRVRVRGVELEPPLSLSQYRLLELLYQHADQVVSREDVVKAVWADEASEGVSEQAIDALARRLRERIAEVDPDNQYVVTVRGHGYRLQYITPANAGDD